MGAFCRYGRNSNGQCNDPPCIESDKVLCIQNHRFFRQPINISCRAAMQLSRIRRATLPVPSVLFPQRTSVLTYLRSQSTVKGNVDESPCCLPSDSDCRPTETIATRYISLLVSVHKYDGKTATIVAAVCELLPVWRPNAALAARTTSGDDATAAESVC